MKNRWLVGSLVVVLLLTRTAWPQASGIGAKVDPLFAPWDRKDSPGCVVLVRQDGKVLHERAYGMANLELDVPLSLSSVFLLASVSKQFVVFAIMLLVQSGQVSLDDDIRKYVPEVPDFGPTITLRHLVHHTSGLREDLTLFNLAGWRSGDAITRDDFLRLVKNQKELNFPPGQQYLYCNTGYHLLALVVERVSKRPFATFAREEIFQPLGMKATVVRDNHRTLIPNLAAGYGPRPQSGFQLARVGHDPPGASNVHSTVGDLALWDQNFYDSKLGGKKLLDLMHVQGKLTTLKEIKYGGGLVIDTYRGLKTVSHTGSHGGYKTVILRFPEQRFSVIVLANVRDFNSMRMARKVADVCLDEHLERQPALPAEISLETKALQALAGEYRLGASFWTVKLEKDTLVVQVDGGEKKRLAPSAETEFFDREDQVRYRFVKTDNGMKLETSLGGQTTSGSRLRHAELSAEQLQAHAGIYMSRELGTFGSIQVRKGKLFLESLKGDASLQPLEGGEFLVRPVDAFFSSLTTRFTRDPAGQINGYLLSTERVRNLRYNKVIIE